MRTRGLLLIVALLLLGAAPSGRADQSDPAAVAKAKEMLAVSRQLQTLDAILVPISQSMEGLLERANPGREKDVREFMLKYYLPEVHKRLPEIGDLMAELWARYFTAAELDQLILFYKSDIGQKVVSLQPRLFQDGMQLGTDWGERVAREALLKMEPELKNRGLKSPNI
ncbi:MAG TPA: DUF2059 domain-containing protein [Dongiaceae bacterium]|jgi:hypothetical protein|nr:DUF2059 domain-containing protein [Dongiaceae bacterium]